MGMARDEAEAEAVQGVKLDFKKNVKRNMLANAVSSGIRLLFPFLNRTLFLWLLGPEYLGLNGLFASVLGVLMLAELGFGTAVVCSMYKPVADDDRELLPAYLRFVRGVIDSEDLPLNVSREILQQNRILSSIKSQSVKKLLGEFKKMGEEADKARKVEADKRSDDEKKAIEKWNTFVKNYNLSCQTKISYKAMLNIQYRHKSLIYCSNSKC